MSEEILASELRLFLARKKVGEEDTWLKSKDPLVGQLRSGEIPQEVERLYMKDEIVDPADALRAILPRSFPKTGRIHVLVKVTVKRPRLENAEPLMEIQRSTVTWTSTLFDPSASTLPRVDGHPLSTWKLDAATISGFGLHRQDENLVLFSREDAVKLFEFLQHVVRNGQCGYVLGPPGSGKSATAAAFALMLARTDGWVVTWIRLSRFLPSGFVRLNGDRKQTASVYDLTADKLYNNLKGVDDAKKHIVFLDGVTADDRNKVAPCVFWLEKDRANRRLVVVSSMSSRGKVDDMGNVDLGFRDHFVPSWKLSEYLEAVQDNELFESVRSQLDASDAAEPDEARLIPSWRQTLVRSKYYFAGGNARYMFDRSTAQVVESLSSGR